MRKINDQVDPNRSAGSLLVLLPCAYGTPEDFQREGFVDAVRARALDVDIVLADMNLECITDGTSLPSLRNTVIAPAREAGYANIFIAGISIGGFMAISYADQYPGEVDGLYLIAPYLSNRIITGEIIAAGGILKWSPTGPELDDRERRAWNWVKMHTCHANRTFLGYGRSDRFAATHKMLASLLPAAQIETLVGGHDWATWRNIWDRLLDRGIITRRARDEHPEHAANE